MNRSLLINVKNYLSHVLEYNFFWCQEGMKGRVMINLGMGSEMTDLSNQECGGVSIKKLKRCGYLQESCKNTV